MREKGIRGIIEVGFCYEATKARSGFSTL